MADKLEANMKAADMALVALQVDFTGLAIHLKDDDRVDQAVLLEFMKTI